MFCACPEPAAVHPHVRGGHHLSYFFPFDTPALSYYYITVRQMERAPGAGGGRLPAPRDYTPLESGRAPPAP